MVCSRSTFADGSASFDPARHASHWSAFFAPNYAERQLSAVHCTSPFVGGDPRTASVIPAQFALSALMVYFRYELWCASAVTPA